MVHVPRSVALAALGSFVLVACGGGAVSGGSTVPRSGDGPTAALDASRPRCIERAAHAPSDGARRTVQTYVELLLTLRPGMDWDVVNQQLDAGYRGILDLEADGRAAARERVLAEVAASTPNDFVLLDLGHFIISDDCLDVRAATTALLAIDPNDPLVVVGARDLFEMAHNLATRGDSTLLPALDRMVTADRGEVFIPAHVLELDPALQGVFLYGALSVDSASHVASRLARDEANRDVLLEILGWIGSPEIVPEVAAVARVDGDLPTILRVVNAAMRVGGPVGRQAVLDLPRASLSAEAREYLDSIHDDVVAEGFPDDAAWADARRIPPDELRTRLMRMIANDGRDDTLDPASLLVSDLSNAELIGYLRALRVAMLRRVSDEALDEVQITNRLINLIAYRPEPASSR